VAAGVAASILTFGVVSSAGLIIEFADDLGGIEVTKVEPGEQQLTFEVGGRRHAFKLPPGTRDRVVEWAVRDRRGPLVFSIDGSLVPNTPGDYWPASVPFSLAQRLFAYDSYAHAIACGAVIRGRAGQHPLVLATGTEQHLPYRRYEALLDTANKSVEATWYRRLAGRFVAPPACVGELTLRVSRGAVEPVKVEVDSWLHQLTEQWYRGIDVPSESDSWASRLPYRDLKQDMERRWDTYRQAFLPLDELTTIAEAMALLRTVRVKAPSVFASLQQEIVSLPDSSRATTSALYRSLDTSHLALPREPWRRLSEMWVGADVETPAEANLALSLIRSDRRGDPSHEPWWSGIERVAQRDRLIRGKLSVARLLSDPKPLRARLGDLEALFKLLHDDLPDGFRLRAQALTLLEVKLARDIDEDDPDPSAALAGPSELLQRESKRLIEDFVERATRKCAASPAGDEVEVWESLTQDVYSVGLLDRAAGHRALYPQVIRTVACVHHRRAMVQQVGRELAIRHAHFRFLGYLRMQAADSATRAQINDYRRHIADAIGLGDAEVSP
jgi:hypothetical protein